MKCTILLFISLCGFVGLSVAIDINEVVFRNLVSRIENLEKENLDLRRQLEESYNEQDKKIARVETGNRLFEGKGIKLYLLLII